MATLASATLDQARCITDVMRSVTTAAGAAGATTTIDTAQPRVSVPDDHWNQGTLWFISPSTAAIANTTAVVTDYTSSSGTFTHAAAAAQVAASVQYAVCEGDFPRDVLRQSENRALQVISEVPQLDTSLTTVADQETYTLASGVYNVLLFQVASATASPYEFVTYPLPPERNGLLYFDAGKYFSTAGHTMRLWYMATPDELTADSGSISQYINPQWLAWQAAVESLRWRVELAGDDSPQRQRQLADAMNMAARLRADWESRLPDLPSKTTISGWGSYAQRERIVRDPTFTGKVRV